MNLIEENCTRKVDALGRIVIPNYLRSKYGINVGDELSFYTFDRDGKRYIALGCDKEIDPKYGIAAAVLEELGEELPESLLNKLSEE